jgi:hypothetical protein
MDHSNAHILRWLTGRLVGLFATGLLAALMSPAARPDNGSPHNQLPPMGWEPWNIDHCGHKYKGIPDTPGTGGRGKRLQSLRRRGAHLPTRQAWPPLFTSAESCQQEPSPVERVLMKPYTR